MATTTRALFRERISDAAGDWYETLTCDSGTTTTIVDTELLDIPGGSDDDGFLNWYVICTSGNNIGEIRRISVYTTATQTITVSRAFTNAMATQTYELHRQNPNHYHDALNSAIAELFPILYLPIRDETIIVDNHLSNPLFNTFAGGFTDWTEVGSPTVTQETTITIEGDSSAKVVAGGTDGQLTQAPAINIPSIELKTATAKVWGYTTAVTTIRLRLDWGGGVFTNGDYHTGADQWEHLTVSGTIPAGATQVKLICEVIAGGTGYFDLGFLVVEPIYDYTLPSNLLLGPYRIDIQSAENDPNSLFVPFIGRPLEGRRLRLIGKGLLTRPTTDTGTVEVNDAQAELLLAQANFFMNRRLAQGAASQQRQRYLDDMVLWKEQVEEMKRIPGKRSPHLGATVQLGVLTDAWKVEENSTGRVLVLTEQRGTVLSSGFTHLI